MSKFSVTRRNFLQLGALATAGTVAGLLNPKFAFAQGATGTPASPLPAAPAAGPLDLKAAGGIEKLIEAAKKEAELSTIALPDDWANYAKMKKDFFTKYPFLKHNDLNPDASSGDEVEAIKANAGNKGPQNPDVIDVGFIWGQTAKAQGLIQPYKVATWDTIPASAKDADGFYYGNYFGTMAFVVNTQAVKNVPQDWEDLLKPEYKGLIAISGDPTAASQAIHSVWAAAIGSGAPTADPTAGLNFFKKLADSGNLVNTPFTPASLVKGEVAITLIWDYNALAYRDANKDTVKIEVVYPKSGTVAGVYLCGVSAYSPRPNAARLWMEHVYSDEGQLTFLSGYAKPIRFDDMQKRGVIPAELLAKLPKADVKVVFPTVEEIGKALEIIKKGWPEIVGVKLAK